MEYWKDGRMGNINIYKINHTMYLSSKNYGINYLKQIN